MTKHIQIFSVAGAGKTTKLKNDIIKPEKVKSILVLSFNKSIEEELRYLNSYNVKVSTFHSMAIQASYKILDRFFTPVPSYFNSQIKKLLNTNTKTASILINILKDFCYSSFTIDEFEQYIYNNPEYARTMNIDDAMFHYFKIMWDKLLKEDKVSHDVYLKLYQLSKPKLDYDIIVIDEYQDFSSVMTDIINNNKDTSSIVYAGDLNQRIYGFRGASNDLDLVSDETIVLDGTWRCPQSIVDLVNPYLRLLLDDPQFTMKSNNDKKGNIRVIQSVFDFEPDPQDYTYISRTNVSLFILASQFVGTDFNLEFKIGTDMTGIEQHYRWLHNEKSGNKFLDEWFKGSKKELIQYYASTNQENKISQLACAQSIDDLDALKRHMKIFDPESPTITFTNVFMSKGLEYDNVVIVDDFKSPFDEEIDYIVDEELRFIYVAVTRAKESIIIPKKYLSVSDIVQIPKHVEHVRDLEKESYLDYKVRMINLTRKYAQKKTQEKRNEINEVLLEINGLDNADNISMLPNSMSEIKVLQNLRG